MIATSTTERTSRHELLKAARKRLNSAFHPSIRRLACDCDENGTVYLRGSLASYYQKQLAQEAISDLPGIVEIVNQAEVVGAALAATPVLQSSKIVNFFTEICDQREHAISTER